MVIAYLIGAGLSSIVWAVLLSVFVMYNYKDRRQLVIFGTVATVLWPVTWFVIVLTFLVNLYRKVKYNAIGELEELVGEDVVDITYEYPSKLVVLLQNGSELRYAIDNDMSNQGSISVRIENVPCQGTMFEVVTSREEKWAWSTRTKRVYTFSKHNDISSPRVTLTGSGHPYLRKQE